MMLKVNCTYPTSFEIFCKNKVWTLFNATAMKQQLDRCVETRSREVVILVLSVSNTVQIVKAH